MKDIQLIERLIRPEIRALKAYHVPDAAGSRGRAQIWGFSAGGLGGFVAPVGPGGVVSLDATGTAG